MNGTFSLRLNNFETLCLLFVNDRKIHTFYHIILMSIPNYFNVKNYDNF